MLKSVMLIKKRVFNFSPFSGLLLIPCPKMFEFGANASKLFDVKEGPPYKMLIFVMACCLIQTILYIILIGSFSAHDNPREIEPMSHEAFKEWDKQTRWELKVIETGRTDHPKY